MKSKTKILITGAGGFIGHHLVSSFKKKGYWIRGVDIKKPVYEKTRADEFKILDLRIWKNACQAVKGIDEVYALAADMGGMGYIAFNNVNILHNNLLIDLNTAKTAEINKVKKFFYSSSACIYPEYLQEKTEITPLKEEDAYPAQPQDAYGWEKLIIERLLQHYHEECGLKVRIARFHNIFGPLGAWEGGREKAPSAMCRKIAIAKLTNQPEIEIWGDGKQTRSFCYIDDCIKGIYKLARSNYTHPLNIGQDRLITIDELVEIIAKIAGIRIVKKYVKGPQGVRGRSSDNTRLKKVLKWEPEISLEEGLERTYLWIEKQVKAKLKKK